MIEGHGCRALHCRTSEPVVLDQEAQQVVRNGVCEEVLLMAEAGSNFQVGLYQKAGNKGSSSSDDVDCKLENGTKKTVRHFCNEYAHGTVMGGQCPAQLVSRRKRAYQNVATN